MAERFSFNPTIITLPMPLRLFTAVKFSNSGLICEIAATQTSTAVATAAQRATINTELRQAVSPLVIIMVSELTTPARR